MPLVLSDLASPDALRAAWARVAENAGRPGIDGMTVAQFGEQIDAHIETLRAELLAGNFAPRPLRLVQIPRADGRDRPIVIAAVRDRIVHQALAAALALRLEPIFHADSFAYRPRRSALAALERLDTFIQAGTSWVVRADIEDFFGAIDYEVLAGLLAERQVEEGVIRLVHMVLQAPVLDGMHYKSRTCGAPQGLACSPVLSNLYLTPFDRGLERAGYRFVRFADDVAIGCDGEPGGREALAQATALLLPLKLKFQEAKTGVVPVSGGFDFLGYRVDEHGRGPSRKALDAIRRRLEAEATASSPLHEPVRLQALGTIIRGWSEYYGSPVGIETSDPLVAKALRGAVTAVPSDTGASIRPDVPLSPQAPPGGEPRRATSTEAFAAIPRLRQLLKNQPDNAEAFRELAEHYAAIGQFGLAKQAFEQALALRPELADASRERMARPADRTPALTLSAEDRAAFLRLFAGRQGAYARQWVDEKGRRGFSPVPASLDDGALRDHLSGRETLGVYLARQGDVVGQLVIDIDVDKSSLVSCRNDEQFNALERETQRDAARLAAVASRLGLIPLIEDSGYKGRHCWFFFDPPVSAAMARKVARSLLQHLGTAPGGLHREVFPAQDRVRDGRLGSLVKLPLGIHRKSGRRCLFVDMDGQPVADQAGAVRAVQPVTPGAVVRLVAVRGSSADNAQSGDGRDGLTPPTPPLAAVVSGCEVVSRLIGKARGTGYLTHGERTVLLYTVGYLGPDGQAFLHRVMVATINYDFDVTEKYIKRIKESPISCARVQEVLQEGATPLTCACRFHLPRDGYPSPVLHAFGAGRGQQKAPAKAPRVERSADAAASTPTRLLVAAVGSPTLPSHRSEIENDAGHGAVEPIGVESPVPTSPTVEDGALPIAVDVQQLIDLVRDRARLDDDIERARVTIRQGMTSRGVTRVATSAGALCLDSSGRLLLEL